MGEAELGEGENNKTLQPQLCCVGINPIHREAVPLPRLGRRVLAVLGKTSKPSLFSISNEKISIFLKAVSVH